jgi:RNA polymerase sigma-70 factor (ECF subfamily)
VRLVSDDDLIQAAREGHDYAAAFLVSMYGPRVLGYCRAIAPDLSDVDCERVVELAVETAVRKIEKFDPSRGKFEAWLRTFVLHAAQDWRRSHHRLISLEAEGATGEPLRTTVAAPPVTLAQTTNVLAPLIEALHEALPQLSVPDQLVIALRDMEGRSVDEVAGILRISSDACRQRHHRARVRLKALLSRDPRTTAFPGDPS